MCLLLASPGYHLPECGDAGEAGSIIAVPSSVICSWRTRLGCSGERRGEQVPLSFPFALRGSFRSRGSSSDSMAATRWPLNCKNRDWGKESHFQRYIHFTSLFYLQKKKRKALETICHFPSTCVPLCGVCVYSKRKWMKTFWRLVYFQIS